MGAPTLAICDISAINYNKAEADLIDSNFEKLAMTQDSILNQTEIDLFKLMNNNPSPAVGLKKTFKIVENT